ncbi:MAG: polysaccharide pyruvyl transferase family protein [Parachlamydiaceae bacterium]
MSLILFKRAFLFWLILLMTIEMTCESATNQMFWWQSSAGVNFGDDLSHVIVERILDRNVELSSLAESKKTVFAVGSILHFARNDDIIWGSGFREDPSQEKRFERLDVRAVRGPLTRDFLLAKGVNCPEIYGDPVILMSDLFPEFQPQDPLYDYIIIPNVGELSFYALYKNVVSPLRPWKEILDKMMHSRLVISGSLHGLVLAESYGVPARLLKMTWGEPLLKYADYYEATGRPHFRYATSVLEALRMGGEVLGIIDKQRLLDAFPWDYFSSQEQ